MRGFVLINGYPCNEKFYRQGERIADALFDLGLPTDVYKNGEVFASYCADGNVRVHFPREEQYDFAVYLDKDKYLGTMLERSGIRLFNSARAVENCDDKMRTYGILAGEGLPLIESIPAPLCYTASAVPNEAFLRSVAQILQFPLVVKKSYGSFGDGVRLIPGMPELIEQEREWLHLPHAYQRFVSDSIGRDVRVMVIGGKVAAAMERVAKTGEFRSNIELGGEGKKIDLPTSYAATAERAATALGLDYCGVDLLCTAQGPVICEVNSNAFFEGLERTTGVDIAQRYALHIRSCL